MAAGPRSSNEYSDNNALVALWKWLTANGTAEPSTTAPVTTSGAGASSQEVQGTAADGAAAVGNPVQVGGKDGSGNAQALRVDANGNLVIANVNAAHADGQSNTNPSFGDHGGTIMAHRMYPYVQNGSGTWDRLRGVQGDSISATGLLAEGAYIWNGSSWDRVRSVQVGDSSSGTGVQAVGGYYWDATSGVSHRIRGHEGTSALASASRTTTQTGSDVNGRMFRGVKLVIDVTNAGTGSITPKLQGKDGNGIYWDMLVGTALTANGTTVLTVYPGIAAVANVSAADVLTRIFRWVITHNNANAITYSVGQELIV